MRSEKEPLLSFAAPDAITATVLTDRSPLAQGRDLGVIGIQTRRLADIGAKHNR
jgi:hypothetical protein